MRHLISKRPSHGKTWHILSLEPNSEWSKWVAIVISVRIYPSVVLYNPLGFVLVIRFVITTEGDAGAALRVFCGGFGFDYDTSGVSYIGNIYLASNSHYTDTC